MKRAVVFVLTILVALAFPAVSSAISSTRLIEDSKKYDGKTVTFVGEAIGDVMIRGSQAWININDDAYATMGPEPTEKLYGYNSGQAVLLDRADAAMVKVLGDYRHRGDLVRVTGVFREASPDHGGDMMIEGKSLEIVRRGFVIKHPLQTGKAVAAGVLLVVTGLIALAKYGKWGRRSGSGLGQLS